MSKDDVKKEETKADEKAEESKEKVKSEASAEETKEETYDSIVGNSDQKIPYSRFKEVNDAKKAAEAKARELEEEFNSRVEEAVNQKLIESKVLNQEEPVDDYSFLDGTDNATKKEIEELKSTVGVLSEQIKGVSQEAEERILKQEINQLKAAFPAMNVEHVLLYKKMSPQTSLEELAKHSSDSFNNHAKKVFNDMIEKKKQDAETTKVVKRETIKHLPPDKKPKTVQEAQKLMMELIGDD